MCVQVLNGNLREDEYFEDLGIDRKIRLKWLLKKYDGRLWTDIIWLRKGQMAGYCEQLLFP
jgi:hypothetical protein